MRKKLVFVHVPKTGGSAIVDSLKNHQLIVWRHNSMQKEYTPLGYSKMGRKHTLLHQVGLSNLEVFWVIRDPVSRFVSAYNYLENGGWEGHQKHIKEAFLDPHKTIEDFVFNGLKRAIEHKVPHFLPQAFWVSSSNGKLLPGTSLRQESLQEDLNRYLSRLSLPECSLLRVNDKVPKKILRRELGEDIVRKIQKTYDQDYTLFGFHKETIN